MRGSLKININDIKIIMKLLIAMSLVSCYKKKHNAIKADFTINNTTFSVMDSISITDKSNMRYVEYDMGDGLENKINRSNQTFKYKYSNARTYIITAKAFEHVEGLHPHKAKYNITSKTITVN